MDKLHQGQEAGMTQQHGLLLARCSRPKANGVVPRARGRSRALRAAERHAFHGIGVPVELHQGLLTKPPQPRLCGHVNRGADLHGGGRESLGVHLKSVGPGDQTKCR